MGIIKRLVNTLVIHIVHAEKRDLHFLFQTRRAITQGVGLASTRVEVGLQGEWVSVYFVFSSNTEHYEYFFLPVLFDKFKYCRDVDIKFKEEFFEVVVIELKRYFGCSVQGIHVFQGGVYCLRSDICWLVNICCSLRDLYGGRDKVLTSFKRGVNSSGSSHMVSLKDL